MPSAQVEVPTLEFAGVVTVGGVDAAGPEYTFGDLRGLAIDDQDNIYVLDAQTYDIRIYDRFGQYLRSIGRLGHAPGELQNPLAIAISADTVFIRDVELQMFDTSGTFLGHIASIPSRMLDRSYAMNHTKAGIALSISEGLSRGARQTDTLGVRFLDQRTGIVGQPIVYVPYKLYDAGGGTLSPATFGVIPALATASSGNIYSADSTGYAVAVFSPNGRRVENIRIAIPSVRTTSADYADYLNSISARAKRGRYGRLKTVPKQQFRPAVGRMIVSPTEEILIQRYDLSLKPYDRYHPDAIAIWELVSADRRIKGRGKLPMSFIPYIFEDSTLTGVVRDSLRAQSVVQYKIRGSLAK